ncbi:coiled-coil domain-containing protein 34 [Halyomorpha halys]|uniref:coiled-coil domain-containing protein 34 n=1 Tax=Halyomorpha halys TaxID=286706 RepID=UPI0006D4DED4|nr:uncharacterized protein LOC106691046 [Halyomorpha halys]
MTGSKLQEINSQKFTKKNSIEKHEEKAESENSNSLEEIEQKSEATSNQTSGSYKSSDVSSSSVLTETLSPWRAAAILHVQTCRAKCIQKYGKDIHLHSDDSDTMIKLKEKITPSCAQVADKERIRKKHKKVSKLIPTAFDEWLQKKNKELKYQTMHTVKQQEIKELKEAAEEAKKAKKRTDKVEKWRKNRQHFDNEAKAIAKIMAREKSDKQFVTDLTSNIIAASEWEKIRQAAEDMKYIEPLQLGRFEGQGNPDPGKYLTKYVVQPDPSFRARYKHLLEAEEAMPTEIILDGDHKDGVEDPAELPRNFKQMLKVEAKKLKDYLSGRDSWNKDSGESESSWSLAKHKKIKSKSKKLAERHKALVRKVSSIYKYPSAKVSSIYKYPSAKISSIYSGSCQKKK